jgi:hypothetical protein
MDPALKIAAGFGSEDGGRDWATRRARFPPNCGPQVTELGPLH